MKKRVTYKTKTIQYTDENGLYKPCYGEYKLITEPGYINVSHIYTFNTPSTVYVPTRGIDIVLSGTYTLYEYGVLVVSRPITQADILNISCTNFTYTYNRTTNTLHLDYLDNGVGVCRLSLKNNKTFSFNILASRYITTCNRLNTNPATLLFNNQGSTADIIITGTIRTYPEDNPGDYVERILLLSDLQGVTSDSVNFTVGQGEPVYDDNLVEIGAKYPITSYYNIDADRRIGSITVRALDNYTKVNIVQSEGTYYILTIDTIPVGATVYINGREGRSLALLENTEYTYEVSMSGLNSVSGSGTITQNTSFIKTLTATLTINPTPADATVIINGEERSSITLPYNSNYTYKVSSPTYLDATESGTLTKNTTKDIHLRYTQLNIDNITTTKPLTGRTTLTDSYTVWGTGTYHITVAGQGTYGRPGGICDFNIYLDTYDRLHLYKINGNGIKLDRDDYFGNCGIGLFLDTANQNQIPICIVGGGAVYKKHYRSMSFSGKYYGVYIGGSGYKGGKIPYESRPFLSGIEKSLNTLFGVNYDGSVASPSYANAEVASGCSGGNIQTQVNTYDKYSRHTTVIYETYCGGSGYINQDLINNNVITNVTQIAGSSTYDSIQAKGNTGAGYVHIEIINT